MYTKSRTSTSTQVRILNEKATLDKKHVVFRYSVYPFAIRAISRSGARTTERQKRFEAALTSLYDAANAIALINEARDGSNCCARYVMMSNVFGAFRFGSVCCLFSCHSLLLLHR